MTDSLPDTVTPGRLTEALLRGERLHAGQVSEVAVERSWTTIVSTIVRLRLGYTGDGDGPTHVLFKGVRPDIPDELADVGRKEVVFYERVAPATRAGLLPGCFQAVGEPKPARPELLLEDLTDSHVVVSEWPLPPTIEQCERIIDAYARFHASWWGDPRLGTSVGTFMDDAAFEQLLAKLAQWLATFSDRLGDRLSAERRDLYQRFLRAAPRLLARYRSHEHLTVVHGDAHVWNLLYPRNPAATDIRLIDWDGWRVDTATDDLAYMMAVHWYPDRRRALEGRLLRRYHAALVEDGVTVYGFDALKDDYRLSVLWQLVTPVWQATHKLGPWIWWSHLERVMAAVDDLGCRELLD